MLQAAWDSFNPSIVYWSIYVLVGNKLIPKSLEPDAEENFVLSA